MGFNSAFKGLNMKRGMLYCIYSIAENDMDLAEVEIEEEPIFTLIFIK